MLTLKKPWVVWLYQASHTTNSRGVTILVAKTTQFTLLTLRSDPQGRFLFLHARINGLELLILAIYVPPPFQFNVLTESLTFMSQFPTVPAIWMGNFNNVVGRELDRLTVTPHNNLIHSHIGVGKLLHELALVDTWRHCHPQDKVFSCFSSTHNTMSRFLQILISHFLLCSLVMWVSALASFLIMPLSGLSFDLTPSPQPMSGNVTPFGYQWFLAWGGWRRVGILFPNQ